MTPDELEQAACRGMPLALFFPSVGTTIPPEVRAACGRCPVRAACLDEGLAHRSSGVWGGLSERARRGLDRDRKRAGQGLGTAAA